MRVKSYFAESVEAAMASAAKEMGPDAVLITSRRNGADAQHLGAYEVVFGSTSDAAEATPPPRVAASYKNVENTASDVDVLRAELAEMRQAFMSACRHASSRHWMPELGHADTILTEADVPMELKDDVLGAVDARLRDELLYDQGRTAASNGRKPRLRATESMYLGMDERILPLLREQFHALLEVAPGIEPRVGSRAVAALVGPSGSGKTTTIVKLAIRHGLAARRSVMIVSTDSYRAGATEQLRVYAAAIGVPFQIAESPLELSQILDEHGNKQLILIDTPGAAPSDMDMNADLARFLSNHPEVQTHLVLPATANAATLAGVVRRFSCFKPEKAILTKFDEADTYGAALGQAILSSLPISFLTTGQQVPDDLVPADKDRLLHFLAGSKVNRAASAA